MIPVLDCQAGRLCRDQSFRALLRGAPDRELLFATKSPIAVAAAIMDSSIVSREVVVGLEEGLHLTPLRALTILAEKFACSISIKKGDRQVDAKSMLDLMTLMAEFGTQLQLTADGPDAEDAIHALGELFDNNFRPTDQG